ncbi:lipase family protein [Shewanella corallii]|uniref:Lipase family protein n=1 Tax=Shewanella corallii TaxID=560080 RepID=A0ABT0N867_9GAMM|nr:lipase family protein [Shewanella corallii]MCL2914631.1 lipase family protein [Shewanella corallii]
MDANLKNRLKGILSLAYQQDWNDESFSVGKAQVCAELSSIVYEDVQEYELKKASRIHLFASETYRSLIANHTVNSILDGLGEANLDARFFIVRGRYALVLGTILNDVVILAIRGTVFRELWDWKANIDAEKYYVYGSPHFHPFDYGYVRFDDQFFHRGFFESVIPQFASISDQIKKRQNSGNELKVVWTGHSLGGAMAAVGYAIHGARNTRIWLAEEIPGHAICAYTFGMPRYCGLGSVCNFPGPHHIYRKNDLVPTVPLRKMGFADSSKEYELTDTGTIGLTERTDTFGLAGHVPKLLSSIKAHSIEGYAELLALATGIGRP